MNLTKGNLKKIYSIILFTVVLFVAVQNYEKIARFIGFAWGIIFPFVLGGIIAFILNIPMKSIEKHIFNRKKDKPKKYARPLSLIITIVLVLAIIAAVILIVVPQIGETVMELTKTAELFFPKVQVWAEELFRDNVQIRNWIAGIQFNTDKLIETLINFLRNGAGNVLNSTVLAAKAVVSGIAAFLVGVIFAFYLLAKKETLLHQVNMFIKAALPEKMVNKITYVSKLSSETFSNFIAGQCLEALILGTMFFIVMSIIRLPYPLLIGVLIAFTALIPIFGAFIGCVIGAFLIIMVSPMQALIFIIVFIVLQQIEGNVIYPKVVGNSVGLPSLWVLAAVTIGSSLMGIPGMLLFIPLTSVIYTLVREWTYKRLEKKNLISLENENEENQEEKTTD